MNLKDLIFVSKNEFEDRVEIERFKEGAIVIDICLFGIIKRLYIFTSQKSKDLSLAQEVLMKNLLATL